MRGKPFQPGNKHGKGRPRGSRNKRTMFQEVLESRGEAIIKQSQLLALKGDSTALRLCMERLVPIPKPATSRFRLPPMRTAQDVTKVLPAVMRHVSNGRLSAQEGESIARVIDTQLRTIETGENCRAPPGIRRGSLRETDAG